MRRLFAFFAALLFFGSACSSDDSAGPGDDGNLFNGTFSATVGGSSFNAATAAIIYQSGIVTLGASSLQNRSISWEFVASGPGTYTIAAQVGNSVIYAEDGDASWWAYSGLAGSGGSVTFTTLNASRATGSFNFTLVATPETSATGTKTLTGNFNIDLTY